MEQVKFDAINLLTMKQKARRNLKKVCKIDDREKDSKEWSER